MKMTEVSIEINGDLQSMAISIFLKFGIVKLFET